MSKGDINDFLSALFQREAGGKNSAVVNYAGYIGKYQFGETALIDLGYYSADGTASNDWTGNWTGKRGVKTLSDFLNDSNLQDEIAKEWIKLLCKRLRHQGLGAYIGSTIKGIEITDSGIIAGAHLKGFGTSKHPGVKQFLITNGQVDPADGLGTTVSDYVRRFSGYDVGCSKCVSMAFVEKQTRQPIHGLVVQVKKNDKPFKTLKTNEFGLIDSIRGFFTGDRLEISVQRLSGGYKLLKSSTVSDMDLLFAFLSPKARIHAATLPHRGPAEPRLQTVQRLPKRSPPNESLDTLDALESLWNNMSGSSISRHSDISPKLGHTAKDLTEKVKLARNTKGHPVAIVKKPPVPVKKDAPAVEQKLIAGLLFPLPRRPEDSYKLGVRKFGAARSNGKRRHAGVDLYAPVGTSILAMADGTVIQTYAFYGGTYAIEINHGSCIARYGEVDADSILVARGDKIKQGQKIAEVGKLLGLKVSMLHLEMYKTTEDPIMPGKQLTQRGQPPYLRRSDLIDPTPSIDQASLE